MDQDEKNLSGQQNIKQDTKQGLGGPQGGASGSQYVESGKGDGAKQGGIPGQSGGGGSTLSGGGQSGGGQQK